MTDAWTEKFDRWWAENRGTHAASATKALALRAFMAGVAAGVEQHADNAARHLIAHAKDGEE